MAETFPAIHKWKETFEGSIDYRAFGSIIGYEGERNDKCSTSSSQLDQKTKDQLVNEKESELYKASELKLSK
ncbi:hypothetical protein TNCT_649391 [Trichonephila clavata]|uniref:Uncharacterized protein n=1 Tax=Trichonephila clavata TaxID=2740835 RepID=A0A8X6HL36_TRICU|nr:hypothetical protein TNCT_649391 [Trichonephila clavata]